MSEFALETRNQLVGLFGIVERNVYLTKRYFVWDLAFMVWTIANTLTIVFIAARPRTTAGEGEHLATALLVGATIWAFLGIIFEFMTETVAWERWEGTIEYTFMAPLSRLVHLFGQGAYAVLMGWSARRSSSSWSPRSSASTHLSELRRGAGVARARVALVHRRRDHDLGAAADLAGEGRAARLRRQGLMLVVSGVYYPVSVMPEWMQWISKISPATYALRGCRNSIIHGTRWCGRTSGRC